MSRQPAPHGSPAGHDEGCRLPAHCPRHDDPDWLTCAEAAVRRRSDYRVGKLPPEQPVPRVSVASPPPAVEAPRAAHTRDPEPAPEVHGTPWGYQRGCHDDRLCPNWALGRQTCAGARRRYLDGWRSGRLGGRGAPVEHGTSNGYLLGCRDARSCPGGDTGATCPEARTAYRRECARAAGIAPRAETLSAAAAAERVREWRRQGRSIREISALTGCGRTTIGDLGSDDPTRRRRVTARTMRLILNAEPT